jgi:hypothetical protein
MQTPTHPGRFLNCGLTEGKAVKLRWVRNGLVETQICNIPEGTHPKVRVTRPLRARFSETELAVFVLDKRKRPLVPCSRARLLLTRGPAVVHHYDPFGSGVSFGPSWLKLIPAARPPALLSSSTRRATSRLNAPTGTASPVPAYRPDRLPPSPSGQVSSGGFDAECCT